MKTSMKISVLCLLMILSVSSFAVTEYVIANENNSLHKPGDDNSLIVYSLDTATGSLTEVARLATGGAGLSVAQGLPVNFAYMEQAVSPHADCIFALNAGTSDIASFSKTTHYSRVGNYSNVALDSSADGGSLALTPNGEFLYASYSLTSNIGAWAVNPDCSLSLVGVFTASDNEGLIGTMKVTPNGEALIAPVASGLGEVGMFTIDSTSGVLAYVGAISFPDCGNTCSSWGALDITKDSSVVILPNTLSDDQGSLPVAYAANITPAGLVRPRIWSLKNSQAANGNNVAFFSTDGYDGSGSLFFGMANGVVTANFTEKPVKITPTNATLIQATLQGNGATAVLGNLMIIAEIPNQIGVFSINSDGSLSELSTAIIPQSNAGMFSLSVFPNSR